MSNLDHVPTSNSLWVSILSPRLSIYTSTYISKRLVDKAKFPGFGIALEELAGIRERYRKGRFKRMMASSPFNQLAQSNTNLPQNSLGASNIALLALSMLEGLVIEGVRNPLVLESISLVGLGSNL